MNSQAAHDSTTCPKWRRVAAAGVLMLLGVLAVSGCGGPSYHSNALVVHVVAPQCEHEPEEQPLLLVEKVVEGFGKATTTEWRTLRRLEQCGSPFAGHSWDGEVLQVWVSTYQWPLRQQARMQLGHRVIEANTWAVGDEDRFRIDYSHIFLGTIDTGGDDARFVPASAVEATVAQLEDRQGCETGPSEGCARLALH